MDKDQEDPINKASNEPVNRYGQPITIKSRNFTLSTLIAVFLFVFLGLTRDMQKESFITAVVAGVIFLIFAVIVFFLMQEGKRGRNNKSDDLDS